MTPRTHRLLLLAVSLAFAGIAALVVFSTAGTGDYVVHAPVAGDNAGPALSALAHGHVVVLVTHQPLMGLVSLMLRAPVVIVASAAGSGELLAYRLGALVCLLPLAVLSAALVTAPGPRVADRLPSIVGAGLLLGGPAVTGAVTVGHPEEVLAITLATAAVLAALADRTHAAAILLGLAVGTKPWAVLAAWPVAAALPHQRTRVLTLAALTTLPCVALLPLADPAAFARAGHGVGAMHLVGPASLWWPLGGALHPVAGGGAGLTDHRLPFGLDRSAASLLALLGGLAVVAGLARRGVRRGRQLDPLALLALLGLVRCVVDPVPLEYNLVATLVPLAAWEVLELGRVPVVCAASTVIVSLLFGARLHAAPSIVNALTIAFGLALGAYLASHAFHRRIRSLTSGAADRSRPVPSLASGVPA